MKSDRACSSHPEILTLLSPTGASEGRGANLCTILGTFLGAIVDCYRDPLSQ